MKTKMTHEEFISFCRFKGGIIVHNISRNYVYVETGDLTKTIVISPLSNCRTDIYDGAIYPTIDFADAGSNYYKISLEDAILNDRKFYGIMILRNHFQLGLKQAKDLFESNLKAWRKEVGKKSTPRWQRGVLQDQISNMMPDAS